MKRDICKCGSGKMFFSEASWLGFGRVKYYLWCPYSASGAFWAHDSKQEITPEEYFMKELD